MEDARGTHAGVHTNPVPEPAALQQWLCLQGIRVNDATAARLLKTVGRLAPSPHKDSGR